MLKNRIAKALGIESAATLEAKARGHRAAASLALTRARLARTVAENERREVERAGYVLVPNEVAAFVSRVVSQGGIGGADMAALLVDLGLAKREAHDPANGTCIGDPEPGDVIVRFTPTLLTVLRQGAPHLRDIRRGLH